MNQPRTLTNRMAYMANRSLLALLLIVSVLPSKAFGAEEGEDLDPVHHVADGPYLDFSPIGKVMLPKLYIVETAQGGFGIEVFANAYTAYQSGRWIPESANHGAAVDHAAGAPAHETAATGNATYTKKDLLEAVMVPAAGQTLLLDMSLTRHLVFAWLAMLLLLFVFIRLAARYAAGVGRETAPHGLVQNVFETLIVFVRDEIAKPNIGPDYRRYLPFLLTVFFFIWSCNLLGLVPFGATATSNIMVTATLAIFTFGITHLNANKAYWAHIFWPPGVPVMVKPILIPVEILGIFTKPFALAIRLFANLTAGHLVILSLLGLIFTFNKLFGAAGGWGVAPVSVAFSLFIYVLELLVAFIQAFIFTMLSALFIGMAVQDHHADEHGAHESAH